MGTQAILDLLGVVKSWGYGTILQQGRVVDYVFIQNPGEYF
jgi:hypothetical protein